jgi:hypothetical protein
MNIFTPKATPVLPLTARREHITLNPYTGYMHNGVWVVRDSEGDWIDADQYRNDLKARYADLVIEED